MIKRIFQFLKQLFSEKKPEPKRKGPPTINITIRQYPCLEEKEELPIRNIPSPKPFQFPPGEIVRLGYDDEALKKTALKRHGGRAWCKHKCNACRKLLEYCDVYECTYCRRVHCGAHRLPENHSCKQMRNVRAPPQNLREIHSKHGTIATGHNE